MTTKKATRPTAPTTPAPSVIPAEPEGPIEKSLPKNSRIGASLRNLARTLDRFRRK